jgi:hypothetical protein
MTAYGSVDVQIHIFLTSALVEVNGQLHAPAALPPGKDPTISIASEAGWPPQPIWALWRSKNLLPYRDSNSEPLVAQPVASPYTNCAIPAH